MKLLTLQEYAKEKSLSYEAVRRQVARYRSGELKNHVITESGSKRQYLDEYAINFLNAHRQQNPVSVVTDAKTERTKELEESLETAKQQINNLQQTLIELQQSIIGLQNERAALLVDKAAMDQMQQRAEKAESELASYTRTWFGLYRKS